MKLGDFLNTLAAKLGEQNNEQLKSLLSNATISQTDIADDFATKITSGLLSMDGAKNSTEALNHFKPIILKAVDDKFAILAEKYGITDLMQGEKNTYKKADILETKLAALIEDAKKGKGGKEGDDAEVKRLNTEIAKLQSQLAAAETAKTAEISKLTETHKGEILNMLITAELAGKQYANDKPPNATIAKTLLDAELKKSGAILVNENGTIKLKNAETPTMDYFDKDHNPVAFGDYVQNILATSGLLKVSNPVPPKPPIVPPTNPQVDLSKFNAAVQAAQQDLQTK